ncbi:MAG: hypothetical protein B0W54_12760 [Cellvibrio sp. 79]|nr:MAG: hypothetical protein B0W54_12760 [Cellvibrio sp. 79]
METTLCANHLFQINLIQIYDVSEDAVSSFFEVIKNPDVSLGLFDTYEMAEIAALSILMNA